MCDQNGMDGWEEKEEKEMGNIDTNWGWSHQGLKFAQEWGQPTRKSRWLRD